MFTGIIEHVGRIVSFDRAESSARLRVDGGSLAASLAVSGSVAVNGCCLTVVELSGDVFDADLSAETLHRTSFGEIRAGAQVNLERPLTAGKELGGHFVQGHVDGIGRVAHLTPDGPNWWLGIDVPPQVERYVAMKGSIAIDGISLTVARISARPKSSDDAAGTVVEAAIIPFTYAHTNLRQLAAGDAVNLEVDILAKYVERLLNARASAVPSCLTMADLVEQGF